MATTAFTRGAKWAGFCVFVARTRALARRAEISPMSSAASASICFFIRSIRVLWSELLIFFLRIRWGGSPHYVPSHHHLTEQIHFGRVEHGVLVLEVNLKAPLKIVQNAGIQIVLVVSHC